VFCRAKNCVSVIRNLRAYLTFNEDDSFNLDYDGMRYIEGILVNSFVLLLVFEHYFAVNLLVCPIERRRVCL